jgi:hypothetical protein
MANGTFRDMLELPFRFLYSFPLELLFGKADMSKLFENFTIFTALYQIDRRKRVATTEAMLMGQRVEAAVGPEIVSKT